ncbi:MAG: hypothetical protein OHK0023_22500 [Anaerolineae bacterium]
MVTQPIITVENVSKRYTRTEARPSLRHEAVTLLRRIIKSASATQNQPFLALDGVSFSVQPGESIGIVGRNGAGKTTLLKLLSGIAKPTEGRVTVRGRFAALIGLQAGFISEMSGRKNIYLNAAFHGVSPKQIEPMVQKIIDFSELQSFIESPVKHYSSGMSARLGFSIAAHVLPDIVFLDEALAVGDLAFQQKCIRKMEELKADGRTLLYVSHDPDSVRKLCERVLWLDQGKLRMDGETALVLEEWLAFLSASNG